MKAHNPIDDMFKQHFAEATVPMNNQEELWTRISSKKDDERRGIFWLGAFGLVLCVVAGLGISNLNNSVTKDLVNKGIVESNIINSNSPNNIEKNHLLLAKKEADKESMLFKENSKNSANDLEKSRPKLEIANKVSKRLSNLNQANNSNKRNVMGGSKNNFELNEISSSNSPIQKSIVDDLEVVVGDGVLDEIRDQNLAKSLSIRVDDQFVDIGRTNHQLSNNTPPSFIQSDSWSRCEVKTPGHFFIDAYGQAGLPMDMIDFSQAGSDQTAYRELWDIRFDPAASWHGGAQIGYELRNGLRVSAGAEYQELVTEYSDNQQITETIRVWDPQAFFTIDVNGDRVWVGDTVTAINIYERKFVRKNKHTLFHIPIQLSYDVYNRPGFHVAVDVGAALNISKAYEGQYIRSDQTLIMVDSNNQDNYISKDIGVSFSAGLHVGKYFNDNWEVYVSPRFRYNPNSYLLDTETLKITRNIIGLRAGVRYHF